MDRGAWRIAVSDKTLDATGTLYTSDPERIAITMLAYDMRMTEFNRYRAKTDAARLHQGADYPV